MADAVTVTHNESGQACTCSTEDSVGKNRKRALQTLQAKIWEKTNVLHSEDKFTFKVGGS